MADVHIRSLPRWVPGPWRALERQGWRIRLLRFRDLQDRWESLSWEYFRLRDRGPGMLPRYLRLAEQMVATRRFPPPTFAGRVTISGERLTAARIRWRSSPTDVAACRDFTLTVDFRDPPTDAVIAAVAISLQIVVNGALTTDVDCDQAVALARAAVSAS